MVKYESIAEQIRKRILNQSYQIGSLIPDQISLAQEFNVSRMTIKKALDILAMEGLIYRQRGSGTYVMKSALLHSEDVLVHEYPGLTRQMEGRDIQSQIIEFDAEFPSETVQEQLMLTENQPVYKIVRLRIVDSGLRILEHTYMSTDLVKGLSEKIVKGSIYRYIQEELGLQFGGAYRKIHADKPTSYDQEYLNCKPDDPVLEVSQVVFLKDGRPLEYSRSRNRYDARGYTVVDVRYKDN